MFYSNPMLSYPILAARYSRLFDKIIVSSDDEEILDVASRLGAIPYLRGEDLCLDSVGTAEVTTDAAQCYPDADYVCCVYATAAMLLPKDLREGLSTLIGSHAYHCIAVGIEPLRTAAMFYWSTGEAARLGHAYYLYPTVVHAIPDNRVCDIDTEDDWLRAEKMYMARR